LKISSFLLELFLASGIQNLLLKSYISERYFQVKHHSSYSRYKLAKFGVPQGSVLGLLLYLMFTADLPTTNNTTITNFADDTALLATNSYPALASQQLQYHLDLLQEWSNGKL
jgi:hypothetical protein